MLSVCKTFYLTCAAAARHRAVCAPRSRIRATRGTAALLQRARRRDSTRATAHARTFSHPATRALPHTAPPTTDTCLPACPSLPTLPLPAHTPRRRAYHLPRTRGSGAIGAAAARVTAAASDVAGAAATMPVAPAYDAVVSILLRGMWYSGGALRRGVTWLFGDAGASVAKDNVVWRRGV